MSAFLVRIFGILMLGLSLGCEPASTAPPAPTPGSESPAPERLPEVELTIGIHRVIAEVANNPARRRQGLSGRRGLEPGRGMIFPYDPPERPAFWMPDMHFDIDIIWIRQGTILDLHTNVPHEVTPPLPKYSPRGPVDWVLEVPAGTAEAKGWKVGDRVQADPLPVFLESAASGPAR